MQENKNRPERLNNWFLKNQIPVVFVTLLFIVMVLADYGIGYSTTRIILVLVILWIIKKMG